MGRHSASGGADEYPVDVLVSDRPETPAIKRIGRSAPRGRHALTDSPAAETTVIPAIQAPILEEPLDVPVDEAAVDGPVGGLDAVLPGVPWSADAPDDGAPPDDGLLLDDGELPDDGSTSAVESKRKSGGTRADLRLLRQDRTLLARSLAAVIVPFVLYTLVLLVISRLGGYLLWIWIPAILAGVLLGSFLDSAHKRASTELSST